MAKFSYCVRLCGRHPAETLAGMASESALATGQFCRAHRIARNGHQCLTRRSTGRARTGLAVGGHRRGPLVS